MDQKELGNRLSLLRTNKGYSQRQVAAFLNVTPQAVSKWERGIGVPDLSILLTIANLYKVSLDNLILFKENHTFKEEYVFEPRTNGKCLRILRKSHRLSLKDFADILGVTFQSVSKWEHGETVPELENILSICQYFDLTLDDYFLNVPLKKYQKSRKKNSLKIFIGLGLIMCVISVPLLLHHGDNVSGSSEPCASEQSPGATGDDTSIDSSSSSSFQEEGMSN